MATEKMVKKRADKIEQILSVATEVFSEKGFHGALTDEIAERAGVPKLSLYYYIGDKEQLYKAVWKRLEDQFVPLIEINEEISAEENLDQLLRGVAKVAEIVPAHSMALRELFAGGENYPENIVKDIELYLERFTRICEGLKREGQSGKPEFDVPPAVIAWMVYSFMVYWVITVPPMLKHEGEQIDVFRGIGTGTNENVVAMVKKLVFRMLDCKHPE
ncbi:TetR/AcrR family transcriptional regulator [Geomonas azotofigens]|uniref:TetR/AcrR family transcriptional regulator n=1 Tax=Geomonas azotofigens TaxID=2843196 RepID=UPI001C125C32|nr:TetR/AcrR family transcriptional regulator [Geomonas azotofigens]MBU5613834.1 TetR/AcrR family transcriptional regulator [Geomonas azotofigens]